MDVGGGDQLVDDGAVAGAVGAAGWGEHESGGGEIRGALGRGGTRRFRAVPLFKCAVEIDPNFALAHVNLGLICSNIGESGPGDCDRRAADCS